MELRITPLLASTLLFTLSFLCSPAISASGDSIPLFFPLTKAEEDRALDKHRVYLEIESYFAKNHKLVRLNPAVLDPKTSSISVDLFDSKTITVSRSSSDQPQVWRGLIQEPSFSLNPKYVDLTNKKEITGKEAEEIRDSYHAFSIDYVFFDKVPSGKLRPQWERPSEMALGTSPILPQDVGIEYNAYTAFTGGFDVWTIPGKYALHFIPDEPDLHLFYEIDPEKLFGTTDSVSGDQQASAEEIEKFRRYNEFLEDRGVDRGLGRVKSKTQKAEEVRNFLLKNGQLSLDEARSPDLYKMLLEAGLDPTDLKKGPAVIQGGAIK